WLYYAPAYNPLYKFLNSAFPFLAPYHQGVALAIVLGIPLMCCFFFANRGIRFGLALGMLVFFVSLQEREGRDLLAARRSFFGVLRVRMDADQRGPNIGFGPFTNLTHGTTLHGQNYKNISLSRMATTYYHQYGPGGRVM